MPIKEFSHLTPLSKSRPAWDGGLGRSRLVFLLYHTIIFMSNELPGDAGGPFDSKTRSGLFAPGANKAPKNPVFTGLFGSR